MPDVLLVMLIAVGAYIVGMALLTELVWGLLGKVTWLFFKLIGDDGPEEQSAIIVGDAYNRGESYYLLWPVGAAALALPTTLLAAGVMFCTLQRIGRKICRILGVKTVIR